MNMLNCNQLPRLELLSQKQENMSIILTKMLIELEYRYEKNTAVLDSPKHLTCILWPPNSFLLVQFQNQALQRKQMSKYINLVFDSHPT